ncbi:MAG: hypothetical protein AAFR58_17865 [Cyanobacteria bacterium J06627_28]
MFLGVRTIATVKSGGLIKVHSDKLTEEAIVEVTVLEANNQNEKARPTGETNPKMSSQRTNPKAFARFFGAAKGNFANVIRQERDSWDSQTHFEAITLK